MAKDAKTSGIFGTAAGALAGVAIAFAPVSAGAEEVTDATYQEVTITGETALVDAAQALKEFTLSGGVGVILDYQEWDGGRPPSYIIGAYSGAFSEENTDVDFRITQNPEPGVSVYFIVNGLSQGPFSANEAYSMIGDISDQNRFAHGIQTSSVEALVDQPSIDPEG